VRMAVMAKPGDFSKRLYAIFRSTSMGSHLP
jgi:hypothetical protein